ncbi:MAG: BrnT family toxin [Parachlamydiales bacterium]|nr:BrnT family toxin [Verrucomicrobiota bacterium]
MAETAFEWDDIKNGKNIEKHGVSFFEAQQAFLDPNRIIAEDLEHSQNETRYYCFGKVRGAVMTVRFTYRGKMIRIFGAGYWREGRKIYEKAKTKG